MDPFDLDFEGAAMSLMMLVRGCFFITVATTAWNVVAQGPTQSRNCADDDYLVFGAVLDQLYGNGQIEKLVLLELTAALPPSVSTASSGPSNLRPFFSAVPEEVQDDFRTRNKSRAKLEIAKIKGPFQVLSLSSEGAQELFRYQEGWRLFHERYPTAPGVIGVSIPGFNREHDRALLYLQMSCGPLCGGGSLFFLTKDKGQWKVAETVTVLQS
jgi:hypothetical protein